MAPACGKNAAAFVATARLLGRSGDPECEVYDSEATMRDAYLSEVDWARASATTRGDRAKKSSHDFWYFFGFGVVCTAAIVLAIVMFPTDLRDTRPMRLAAEERKTAFVIVDDVNNNRTAVHLPTLSTVTHRVASSQPVDGAYP